MWKCLLNMIESIEGDSPHNIARNCLLFIFPPSLALKSFGDSCFLIFIRLPTMPWALQTLIALPRASAEMPDKLNSNTTNLSEWEIARQTLSEDLVGLILTQELDVPLVK